MARARNIKPGVMENEDLAELDPLTRLLFIYLWMLADREGRLEDRPKQIRAKALPYDAVDADAMLADLARMGFLIRYEVEGKRFIQIANFSKHQRPHSNEIASEIPPPSQELSTKVESTSDQGEQDCEQGVEALRSGFSDSLIPDSLIAGKEDMPGEPAPVPVAAAKKPRARKTPLPADFGISDAVTGWAMEKGFTDLQAHLESFRSKCKAKGYEYVDWDSAFMEAIREDWAKLRVARQGGPPQKFDPVAHVNRNRIDRFAGAK